MSSSELPMLLRTIDVQSQQDAVTEDIPDSNSANDSNPPGRKKHGPMWLTRSIVSVLLFVVVALVCWPSSLGGPFTFATVVGESMEPIYHTGDMVVAVRQYNGYEVGQAIVYSVNEDGIQGRVVHRITEKLPNGNYLTRGDNKPFNDPWEVRPEWILGDVKYMIPDALTAIRIMRTPIFLGTMFGLFIMILLWPRNKPKDESESATEPTPDDS